MIATIPIYIATIAEIRDEYGVLAQKLLVALLGLRTEYKKTPIFVAKMVCGTGKRLTVRRAG